MGVYGTIKHTKTKRALPSPTSSTFKLHTSVTQTVITYQHAIVMEAFIQTILYVDITINCTTVNCVIPERNTQLWTFPCWSELIVMPANHTGEASLGQNSVGIAL